MSKITPGPWRLDANSSHVVNGKNLEPVADCRRDSTHPAVEDRCAANARAIAALPELLAAVEELVAEFDTDSARAAEQPGYGGIPDTGGILAARAALAKALGE